ncbi:hypothetical protein HRbin15_02627 [bacterium HR15]|nr:hypothetical protein HRbin15_02627 [bacterium HR15]
MTRREFTQLLLSLPLVSFAAQEARQEPSEPSPESAWLTIVQTVRGESLDEETRRRLSNALKAQNELLARLRQFKLPEGSEPAFVFQPVPRGGKEVSR